MSNTLNREPISAERLRELLSYNRETGLFTWLVVTSRRVAVGDVAGSPDGARWRIHLDSKYYGASRLAWFYVHGHWPQGFIDHRDGNPRNNAIDNLRETTPSGNSQNMRAPGRLNTSGFLGVRRGRRGNWRAEIKIKQKPIYLGEFKTPEAAHAAYVAAKRLHHPTCTI